MSENLNVFSDDPALEEAAEPQALSTIPISFRWATIHAPELRQRVEFPEAISDVDAGSLGRPLLFCGPCGCGKTALACALLREWEARNPGRRGVFMGAWRLGVARLYHGLGMGEAPEVTLAMSTDLLLLDDLGNEYDSSMNAVPDVIYARHEAALPTWVTTSMTACAITQLYGEGLTRRVSEPGRVTVVQWREFEGWRYEFLSPVRL